MARGDARPDLLLAAALRLFTARGVAGTSLQDIADELGVSKAAVYHHYRAKDDIVRAVLEPALASLRTIVATAAPLTDLQDRRESLIRALADEAVEHRALYAVILRDAAVGLLLAGPTAQANGFIDLRDLLTGPRPDDATRVRVGVFLSGLVAPAVDPGLAGVADDELRAAVHDAGRRLLLGD